jgi:hypothetical protein
MTPLTHTTQTVGPWRCEFYDGVDAMAGCGRANTETLAQVGIPMYTASPCGPGS